MSIPSLLREIDLLQQAINALGFDEYARTQIKEYFHLFCKNNMYGVTHE